MPDWELSLSYDHRFATVGFRLHRDNADEAVFYVPLSDLIKQLGVEPHELQAIMSPEYGWTETVGDIEPARHRMLEETDWKDKIVLDVGGYDGFAAEIAHKNGAKRAICLDNHQYEHYGWEEKKKDGVEYVRGDFMDFGIHIDADNPHFPPQGDALYRITYDPKGKSEHWPTPDVIIFFNVLYHLKNPWAYLDRLRKIIKPDGEMLLCTLFRYHEGSWIYLYEEKECNPTDSTVFFGPSLEALERLLKHTGWNAERYALAYDRVLYRCKPIPDFAPILATEGYAKS